MRPIEYNKIVLKDTFYADNKKWTWTETLIRGIAHIQG